MTTTSPAIPTTEVPRRTRNGLRPPVVSTQAENGMRRSEPDSEGAATSNPTWAGVRPIRSLNSLAVGPNSATAANPKKKPSVEAVRPSFGVPRVPGWDMVTPLQSSQVYYWSAPTGLRIPPQRTRLWPTYNKPIVNVFI